MYKFNSDGQHFYFEGENISIPEYPLTVTLQINRKCNLKCVYCSEYDFIEELSLEQINKMIENLNGVNRVIISGGEPLLHKNLFEILSICKQKFEIVALATNATLMTSNMAKELIKYVDYFDVTIDGTRKVHNQIRGSYDEIIEGILNIRNTGGEFSVVTVLFDKNKKDILYTATLADSLGAKKLKILCPIPKGKGIGIISERLNENESKEVYNSLVEAKDTFGYKIKIVMTNWDMIKEGHAILIHPNGEVVASPVWTKDSCVDIVGNIFEDNIKSIWDNYPYKINHLNKYIEKTMMVY